MQWMTATLFLSAFSQLSTDVHSLNMIPNGGAGYPGNENSNTYTVNMTETVTA